jgi:diguanylate cyclase (GGDEF)-like protein
MELGLEIRNAIDRCTECTYVIDDETKELVYLRDSIHKGDSEDHIGCKCYELFGREGDHCKFCPDMDGYEDKVYQWERYDHNLLTWVSIKNMMVEIDGRKYRVGNMNTVQDIMLLNRATVEEISSLESTLKENKEGQKILEHEADYDGMSSLMNRSRFIKDCNNDFLECDSLGIVYMDINGLKQVNDTFGHEYGDVLINRLAGILEEQIADNVRCYRMGGDEFLTVLMNASEKDVDSFETLFHENLKKKNEGQRLICKAASGSSFGIATTQEEVSQLVIAADRKMYKNKREQKMQDDILNWGGKSLGKET